MNAGEGICFMDHYRQAASLTAGQGLWRVLSRKEPLHLEGCQCKRTAYRPPDRCQFTANQSVATQPRSSAMYDGIQVLQSAKVMISTSI